MEIKIEYELNRKWIVDEDGNEIGETNFIVPAEWLKEIYDKEFSNKYSDFELFLDVYEPETDGEYIYRKAIEDGVLKENLGICMYKTIKTKEETKMNYMYEKLKNHIGHNIVCVAYGNTDNPNDICIECEDCNEVLISAETFEEEDNI